VAEHALEIDQTLDTLRQELFTAVVGDVLDAAGFAQQFLPPQIRPLRADMVVVGRAMPVLVAGGCGDTYIGYEGASRPFGLMMEALDDLKPREVYVCTGASPEFALWGGLMSTRANLLGAAGAVVDGYSRDTREITERMAFPAFSHGPYGQDQKIRGRVVDFRCTVRFSNGTVLRPGDLVFGDVDGVLAVPRDYAGEIVAAALNKLQGEKDVRAAIESGMSARAAYDTYGIM
jgi:regulator of RNase E activity RraA